MYFRKDYLNFRSHILRDIYSSFDGRYMTSGAVFYRLFRGRNICRYFRVELVNLLPVHRYSVDIFSYSDPSGILGFDGEQNAA